MAKRAVSPSVHVIVDTPRGSRNKFKFDPQLQRFRNHPQPRAAISAYLSVVYAEATARGYAFDSKKIGPARSDVCIPVTDGQIEHEWQHLLKKLSARSPDLYRKWRAERSPSWCGQPRSCR